MAKVFISHASEDIAVAWELHRWLIEGDHEVFLDQDPRDGIAVGTDPWNQQWIRPCPSGHSTVASSSHT